MSVTFTHVAPGTYDATTDTWTSPITTTVTGNAMQVRGDPETYKALGLVEYEAPTLLFVPSTYGEVPEPGYTVEWASTTYTVKSVQPLQPDGYVILAKVVIGL